MHSDTAAAEEVEILKPTGALEMAATQGAGESLLLPSRRVVRHRVDRRGNSGGQQQRLVKEIDSLERCDYPATYLEHH